MKDKRKGLCVLFIVLAVMLVIVDHSVSLPMYVFFPIWLLCMVGAFVSGYVLYGKNERRRVAFTLLLLTLMTVNRYYRLPVYVGIPLWVIGSLGVFATLFKKD